MMSNCQPSLRVIASARGEIRVSMLTILSDRQPGSLDVLPVGDSRRATSHGKRGEATAPLYKLAGDRDR